MFHYSVKSSENTLKQTIKPISTSSLFVLILFILAFILGASPVGALDIGTATTPTITGTTTATSPGTLNVGTATTPTITGTTTATSPSNLEIGTVTPGEIEIMTVDVVVRITGNIAKATYGPIPIIITSNNKTTKSVDTGSVDASSSASSTIDLPFAEFNGVASGHYKACIEGHPDICSDTFEKVKNVRKTVYINTTSDKVSNYITFPPPTESCGNKIASIGWIVCPVINFLAGLSDASYNVVSSLLSTPPVNTDINDPTNGTYQAWAMMRTFANVAFVIAFIIIIFSQITSVGITNYGIKKLLPRIIIAAILVNLSYFICTIAVDLSNVLGGSLKGVFDSMKGGISAPSINDGTGWVFLITILFGGGAIVFTGLTVMGGLALIFPAVVAALIAVVVAFLVLTVRQALIIILIVISPLAFVAFLLPNTENLFKKWKGLFTTLLLMFPIISVIFGASSFASKVILNSAGTNFYLQTMGTLVAVIPLFITPIIMKTAGSTLAGIGGFIAGSGLAKKTQALANKVSSDEYAKQQAIMNNKAMNSPRRFNPRKTILRHNARNDAIKQNQQRDFARAEGRYITEAMDKNTQGVGQQLLSKATFNKLGGHGLTDQIIAGGGIESKNRAMASIASAADKNFEEQVSAAATTLKGKSFDDIKKIATSGSAPEADRVAAIRQTISKGNYNDRREVYASSSTATNRGLTSISDGFYAAGDQKVFGSVFGGALLDGKVKVKVKALDGTEEDKAIDIDNKILNDQIVKQITGGNVGPEALTDEKLIDHIIQLNEAGSLDMQAKERLSETISIITNSPILGAKIAPSLREKFKTISSLAPQINGSNIQNTSTREYTDPIAGTYIEYDNQNKPQ